MANIKYFSDIDGQTVELRGRGVHGLPNAEFAARFPGVKGLRYDGFMMLVAYPISGTGEPLPVTRKIEYKAFPSRHECNAKCTNGKHNGTCECKCGGRNHGAGLFTSLSKGV
ncbi:Uncharacterised protein [Achromobacter xylosoxidans]|uniref:hypothetical protein n=1 Tax=Achromobacter TaxID=222 RepID=UPI0006C5F627|nr:MULTISPECIES: hypothetical protein [Achromobacter]CAB3920536.1 hypothetical protein LMG26846_05564 [Achromobacter insuavis]CUJ32692.1 Uncharacterised protein [Achromobacter xylosoxidans]CUJ40473.1 Uncharacterised protein [Achromobacter sp. 2789STDY5608621]